MRQHFNRLATYELKIEHTVQSDEQSIIFQSYSTMPGTPTPQQAPYTIRSVRICLLN